MRASDVQVGDIVQLPCNCAHKVTQVVNDDARYRNLTYMVFEYGTTYAFHSQAFLHVRRDAYAQPSDGEL